MQTRVRVRVLAQVRMSECDNSFAPYTVHEWNALPPDIRSETDATKFKTKLLQLTN